MPSAPLSTLCSQTSVTVCAKFGSRQRRHRDQEVVRQARGVDHGAQYAARLRGLASGVVAGVEVRSCEVRFHSRPVIRSVKTNLRRPRLDDHRHRSGRPAQRTAYCAGRDEAASLTNGVRDSGGSRNRVARALIGLRPRKVGACVVALRLNSGQPVTDAGALEQRFRPGRTYRRLNENAPRVARPRRRLTVSLYGEEGTDKGPPASNRHS